MKSIFRNTAESILNSDARIVFLFICILSAAIVVFQKYFILTDEVYYNSLGEQMAYDRIESFLDNQRKMAWIGYALIPVIVFLQIFLVSICLNIGTLVNNSQVSFRKIFSMVTKTLAIPTFLKVVSLLIFYSFYSVRTFDDLANVFTFSLLDLFGVKNVPLLLKFPLASINIIELMFWILLAFGVKHLLKTNFSRSLSFVSYTYGVGFVIWILFVLFLQVNLT